MARTQPGRRPRRREAGTLDRAVTALAALCSALNDPANMIAQLAVASLLLVAETALCLLIIRRVPCEQRHAQGSPGPKPTPSSSLGPTRHQAAALSCLQQHAWCMLFPCLFLRSACLPFLPADTEIDWVAYMQEVGGYLQVRS